LNNECVNIHMTWYQLYNFLLSKRDTGIIDLDYKKNGMFCLITKSFLVIILNRHSWCDLWSSLQKLYLKLVLDQDYYFDGIGTNWPKESQLCKMKKDKQIGPTPLMEETMISFRLSIQNHIQDKNSFKRKSYNMEVGFFACGLFSEFMYTLYFEYYFYFT